MTDDALSQLERLGVLHERGILSDAEFDQAKLALLARMDTSEASTMDATSLGRRIGAREWMATGAATFALLLLGAYWFGSDNTQTGITNEQIAEVQPAELPTDVPAPLPGSALCGSADNYVQLKDMIFEKAAELVDGDPVPLNTLKKAVSVQMELPVVSAVDERVARTDCKGRLVLALPPGTREAFGGEKSLEADLEYSFQPAADGNGYVIRAEGIAYLVRRLVDGATLLNAQRAAAQGGPQLQRTYNPSFDCGRPLSNVERMICQDEQLAAADRIVSAKYEALLASLPPAASMAARTAQREFLKQRGTCADTPCVRSAYLSQWQTLRGIEEAATPPADSPEVYDTEGLNSLGI